MLQVECNNCYKFDYYAFGQEFCAQLVGTSQPLVFPMETTRIQIPLSPTIKLSTKIKSLTISLLNVELQFKTSKKKEFFSSFPLPKKKKKNFSPQQRTNFFFSFASTTPQIHSTILPETLKIPTSRTCLILDTQRQLKEFWSLRRCLN